MPDIIFFIRVDISFASQKNTELIDVSCKQFQKLYYTFFAQQRRVVTPDLFYQNSEDY